MISRLPPLLICAASAVQASELDAPAAFDPGEAQVILLGEVHDNPIHHENQAQAVALIGPSALVFEMFTPDQAETVNAMTGAEADEIATALDWAHSGWPDFAMYHQILTAAPGLPVYGAAIPRDALMAAVSDGAASVFGDGADRFGLSALPEAEQAAREAFQMEAHCNALPEEMLSGMVEAQRLRDARFSQTALKALEETGGPVVVITGNGHSRTDWGMPVYLAAAAPNVPVITLGQFEAPFEPGDEAVPQDYWLVTDPAEREDPCAVFEKS